MYGTTEVVLFPKTAPKRSFPQPVKAAPFQSIATYATNLRDTKPVRAGETQGCLRTRMVRVPLLHEPAGFAFRRAANGEAVDLNRRDADADRNGLSIFTAGADAFIEL
jgi:hypothetical protein